MDPLGKQAYKESIFNGEVLGVGYPSPRKVNLFNYGRAVLTPKG